MLLAAAALVGERGSDDDQDDAEHAQRRQVLAEDPDRERERDQEIALLHRRHEIRAHRLRGAVVAVAAPDEMQDAGEREIDDRLRREAEDGAERAECGGNQKKIGTPSGTVIDSACATEPVSTPRRAVAVSKANDGRRQ